MIKSSRALIVNFKKKVEIINEMQNKLGNSNVKEEINKVHDLLLGLETDWISPYFVYIHGPGSSLTLFSTNMMKQFLPLFRQ